MARNKRPLVLAPGALVLDPDKFNHLTNSRCIYPIVVLTLMFAFAVVQLLRYGFDTNMLILAAGATLACYCLLHYINLFCYRTSSRAARLIRLAGWLPYLFAAYLFFYKGIGQLVAIFQLGFNIHLMLSAIGYLIAGYAVSDAASAVRHFVYLVQTDRIVVSPSSSTD